MRPRSAASPSCEPGGAGIGWMTPSNLPTHRDGSPNPISVEQGGHDVPTEHDDHAVVSRDAWLQERKALLAQGEEMTRLRDALSERCRALPLGQGRKAYFFDTPDGKKSLSDLFEGGSQLIVKHFMLAPGQADTAVSAARSRSIMSRLCCSTSRTSTTPSLSRRTRASQRDLEAFKTRMGWRFDCSSSIRRLGFQLRLRRLIHA